LALCVRRMVEFDSLKQVKEFKRTCNECGQVWHSLASREKQIESNMKVNATSQMCMALTCNPLLNSATLQANRNASAERESLSSLRRCPKCGSMHYKEEIIIYDKKGGSQSEDSVWECDYCEKEFPTREEAEEHEENCPKRKKKLQKCPDCGKEVSRRAAACPHCGAPLKVVKKTH